MRPTAILQEGSVAVVEATHPQVSTLVKGPGIATLTHDQQLAVSQMVANMDFQTMPAKTIVQLGYEAEQSLNKDLDGFMQRLDRNTAAPTFALFERLQKGVKDADLPKILGEIQHAKPGLLDKVVGAIKRSSPTELSHQALERVKKILTDRTKTLGQTVTDLEKELGPAITKLLAELSTLEDLKRNYATHYADFAMAVAMTSAFLEKSKAAYNFIRMGKVAQPQEVMLDLEAKLQMLESRALALEGTFTRLPADAAVIRQVESAGVTTLGETLTTAASRFASIKMTILAIHGALSVKELQNLNAASAELDRSLLAARSAIVKDVAVVAVKTIGDNRASQAEQVMKIVAEVSELNKLVADARKENEAKFAAAREGFAKARQAMETL